MLNGAKSFKDVFRQKKNSISVLVSFSENPLYVEQQGHMNTLAFSWLILL